MGKKIYDILPPRVVHDIEDTVKSLSINHKVKKRGHKKTQLRSEKSKFPLREVLVGGGILVVLLVVYLILRLPRADIKVWPNTDTLTLERTITVDKSAKSLDSYNKIIPAELIEQVKESQQDFPATGIASTDSKSSGTITIYNKTSPPEPLTLIKGTHFLSDSGKYFITLDRVTVPAPSKGSPGSVTVKVQAKEAGKDFNIGPSKFSVPKLSGTAYYFSIWGESKSSMAGGHTGSVKKVTREDIENARDLLTKKLLSQAEESAREKLSGDDVLLDGAVLREVVSSSSDVKAESVADKFVESVKVKVSILVFKKQDLEEFAKADALSQLPEEKNLLESSLNLDYEPDIIDVNEGVEKIKLTVLAKAYYKVEKNDIIDLLGKKTSDQVEEIFKLKYQNNISNIKTEFWPFWVKKSPSNKNRISINLVFE